jgi:methylated-DNA-[protein]-cysteine S-methyltransferase
MQAYLGGEVVDLSLDLLEMGLCGAFQQRVLLAEYAIPRGSVSTYGRIAAHLDAPRAARAVGTALGRNPFPIVIPCHRAVRSDGALGGYRGGLPMKRALLQMEGIAFGPDGKVRVAGFHY